MDAEVDTEMDTGVDKVTQLLENTRVVDLCKPHQKARWERPSLDNLPPRWVIDTRSDCVNTCIFPLLSLRRTL